MEWRENYIQKDKTYSYPKKALSQHKTQAFKSYMKKDKRNGNDTGVRQNNRSSVIIGRSGMTDCELWRGDYSTR